MAKLKPAGGSKKKTGVKADIRAALPCLFIVVAGTIILMVIFFLSLQTTN
jgi:hypothetical protein